METTPLRRQSFALPPSLSAAHFQHFVREATTSGNTLAWSTGDLTCYTVCSMYPRSARNTSTIILRATKAFSSLPPTTAQTAPTTPMGCNTLPWTSMRTTSSFPARAAPVQAVPRAQRRVRPRQPHLQMLHRPPPVRPVPQQQLVRNQLPQKLGCQMYVFLCRSVIMMPFLTLHRTATRTLMAPCTALSYHHEGDIRQNTRNQYLPGC